MFHKNDIAASKEPATTRANPNDPRLKKSKIFSQNMPESPSPQSPTRGSVTAITDPTPSIPVAAAGSQVQVEPVKTPYIPETPEALKRPPVLLPALPGLSLQLPSLPPPTESAPQLSSGQPQEGTAKTRDSKARARSPAREASRLAAIEALKLRFPSRKRSKSCLTTSASAPSSPHRLSSAYPQIESDDCGGDSPQSDTERGPLYIDTSTSDDEAGSQQPKSLDSALNPWISPSKQKTLPLPGRKAYRKRTFSTPALSDPPDPASKKSDKDSSRSCDTTQRTTDCDSHGKTRPAQDTHSRTAGTNADHCSGADAESDSKLSGALKQICDKTSNHEPLDSVCVNDTVDSETPAKSETNNDLKKSSCVPDKSSSKLPESGVDHNSHHSGITDHEHQATSDDDHVTCPINRVTGKALITVEIIQVKSITRVKEDDISCDVDPSLTPDKPVISKFEPSDTGKDKSDSIAKKHSNIVARLAKQRCLPDGGVVSKKESTSVNVSDIASIDSSKADGSASPDSQKPRRQTRSAKSLNVKSSYCTAKHIDLTVEPDGSALNESGKVPSVDSDEIGANVQENEEVVGVPPPGQSSQEESAVCDSDTAAEESPNESSEPPEGKTTTPTMSPKTRRRNLRECSQPISNGVDLEEEEQSSDSEDDSCPPVLTAKYSPALKALLKVAQLETARRCVESKTCRKLSEFSEDESGEVLDLSLKTKKESKDDVIPAKDGSCNADEKQLEKPGDLPKDKDAAVSCKATSRRPSVSEGKDKAKKALTDPGDDCTDKNKADQHTKTTKTTDSHRDRKKSDSQDVGKSSKDRSSSKRSHHKSSRHSSSDHKKSSRHSSSKDKHRRHSRDERRHSEKKSKSHSSSEKSVKAAKSDDGKDIVSRKEPVPPVKPDKEDAKPDDKAQSTSAGDSADGKKINKDDDRSRRPSQTKKEQVDNQTTDDHSSADKKRSKRLELKAIKQAEMGNTSDGSQSPGKESETSDKENVKLEAVKPVKSPRDRLPPSVSPVVRLGPKLSLNSVSSKKSSAVQNISLELGKTENVLPASDIHPKVMLGYRCDQVPGLNKKIKTQKSQAEQLEEEAQSKKNFLKTFTIPKKRKVSEIENAAEGQRHSKQSRQDSHDSRKHEGKDVEELNTENKNKTSLTKEDKASKVSDERKDCNPDKSSVLSAKTSRDASDTNEDIPSKTVQVKESTDRNFFSALGRDCQNGAALLDKVLSDLEQSDADEVALDAAFGIEAEKKEEDTTQPSMALELCSLLFSGASSSNKGTPVKASTEPQHSLSSIIETQSSSKINQNQISLPTVETNSVGFSLPAALMQKINEISKSMKEPLQEKKNGEEPIATPLELKTTHTDYVKSALKGIHGVKEKPVIPRRAKHLPKPDPGLTDEERVLAYLGLHERNMMERREKRKKPQKKVAPPNGCHMDINQKHGATEVFESLNENQAVCVSMDNHEMSSSAASVAAETRAADRLPAEKEVEADRLLTENEVEADRLPAEKEVEAYRLPTEKEVEADRLPAKKEVEADRLPTEKEVEADRLPAEKEVEADRLPAEKEVEADRLPAEKEVEADRLPTEKEVEADRLPAEKEVEADRLPAEKEVEADRLPAEKEVEADRLPAEKEVEADRLPAEKEVEADRLPAEKEVEADRLPAEKEVEADRLPAEKEVEADRQSGKKEAEADSQLAEKEVVDADRLLTETEMEVYRLPTEKEVEVYRLPTEKEVKGRVCGMKPQVSQGPKRTDLDETITTGMNISSFDPAGLDDTRLSHILEDKSNSSCGPLKKTSLETQDGNSNDTLISSSLVTHTPDLSLCDLTISAFKQFETETVYCTPHVGRRIASKDEGQMMGADSESSSSHTSQETSNEPDSDIKSFSSQMSSEKTQSTLDDGSGDKSQQDVRLKKLQTSVVVSDVIVETAVDFPLHKYSTTDNREVGEGKQDVKKVNSEPVEQKPGRSFSVNHVNVEEVLTAEPVSAVQELRNMDVSKIEKKTSGEVNQTDNQNSADGDESKTCAEARMTDIKTPNMLAAEKDAGDSHQKDSKKNKPLKNNLEHIAQSDKESVKEDQVHPPATSAGEVASDVTKKSGPSNIEHDVNIDQVSKVATPHAGGAGDPGSVPSLPDGHAEDCVPNMAGDAQTQNTKDPITSPINQTSLAEQENKDTPKSKKRKLVRNTQELIMKNPRDGSKRKHRRLLKSPEAVVQKVTCGEPKLTDSGVKADGKQSVENQVKNNENCEKDTEFIKPSSNASERVPESKPSVTPDKSDWTGVFGSDVETSFTGMDQGSDIDYDDIEDHQPQNTKAGETGHEFTSRNSEHVVSESTNADESSDKIEVKCDVQEEKQVKLEKETCQPSNIATRTISTARNSTSDEDDKMNINCDVNDVTYTDDDDSRPPLAIQKSEKLTVSVAENVNVERDMKDIVVEKKQNMPQKEDKQDQDDQEDATNRVLEKEKPSCELPAVTPEAPNLKPKDPSKSSHQRKDKQGLKNVSSKQAASKTEATKEPPLIVIDEDTVDYNSEEEENFTYMSDDEELDYQDITIISSGPSSPGNSRLSCGDQSNQGDTAEAQSDLAEQIAAKKALLQAVQTSHLPQLTTPKEEPVEQHSQKSEPVEVAEEIGGDKTTATESTKGLGTQESANETAPDITDLSSIHGTSTSDNEACLYGYDTSDDTIIENKSELSPVVAGAVLVNTRKPVVEVTDAIQDKPAVTDKLESCQEPSVSDNATNLEGSSDNTSHPTESAPIEVVVAQPSEGAAPSEKLKVMVAGNVSDSNNDLKPSEENCSVPVECDQSNKPVSMDQESLVPNISAENHSISSEAAETSEITNQDNLSNKSQCMLDKPPPQKLVPCGMESEGFDVEHDLSVSDSSISEDEEKEEMGPPSQASTPKKSPSAAHGSSSSLVTEEHTDANLASPVSTKTQMAPPEVDPETPDKTQSLDEEALNQLLNTSEKDAETPEKPESVLDEETLDRSLNGSENDADVSHVTETTHNVSGSSLRGIDTSHNQENSINTSAQEKTSSDDSIGESSTVDSSSTSHNESDLSKESGTLTDESLQSPEKERSESHQKENCEPNMMTEKPIMEERNEMPPPMVPFSPMKKADIVDIHAGEDAGMFSEDSHTYSPLKMKRKSNQTDKANVPKRKLGDMEDGELSPTPMKKKARPAHSPPATSDHVKNLLDFENTPPRKKSSSQSNTPKSGRKYKGDSREKTDGHKHSRSPSTHHHKQNKEYYSPRARKKTKSGSSREPRRRSYSSDREGDSKRDDLRRKLDRRRDDRSSERSSHSRKRDRRSKSRTPLRSRSRSPEYSRSRSYERRKHSRSQTRRKASKSSERRSASGRRSPSRDRSCSTSPNKKSPYCGRNRSRSRTPRRKQSRSSDRKNRSRSNDHHKRSRSVERESPESPEQRESVSSRQSPSSQRSSSRSPKYYRSSSPEYDLPRSPSPGGKDGTPGRKPRKHDRDYDKHRDHDRHRDEDRHHRYKDDKHRGYERYRDQDRHRDYDRRKDRDRHRYRSPSPQRSRRRDRSDSDYKSSSYKSSSKSSRQSRRWWMGNCCVCVLYE